MLVIIAAALVPFGRRDPVGFLTVVGPPLVALATALALPGRSGALLNVFALVYLAVFVVGGRAVWTPWTRHVLRRPLPSPEWRFDVIVVEAYGAARAASIAAGTESATPAEAVARAAIARLAAHPAPTPAWADLQRRLVADLETEIGSLGAQRSPQNRARPARELGARKAEIIALRMLEPEWKGLHRTFGPEDVPLTG
jgi:hypothetical protein